MKSKQETTEQSVDLRWIDREIKDTTEILKKQREKTAKSREAEEDFEKRIKFLQRIFDKIDHYEQIQMDLGTPLKKQVAAA